MIRIQQINDIIFFVRYLAHNGASFDWMYVVKQVHSALCVRGNMTSTILTLKSRRTDICGKWVKLLSD